MLQTIRDNGAGLYMHIQAVDTTTPAGCAMFGMLGVFAKFERDAGPHQRWAARARQGRPEA